MASAENDGNTNNKSDSTKTNDSTAGSASLYDRLKLSANSISNVLSAITKPRGENKSWGYDLYPERKGLFKPSLVNIAMMKEGREQYRRMKCEEKVYDCVKKEPLVKLMISALRSSGCPIDIRRHISCESCDESVTGGYDPELNQVVVCQNTGRGKIQGVLTHEFIHMFDYCNNNLDFKNIEHLACTEIRAANLAHCSFLSAYAQADADFFNIRQKHKDCVKSKALYSVLSVRRVTKEEAIAVIEKVFPKCYADLEPVGRRIRRKSCDPDKAYNEGHYFGYY